MSDSKIAPTKPRTRASVKTPKQTRASRVVSRQTVLGAKTSNAVEFFGNPTKLADYLGVSRSQPKRWLDGKEVPKPHTARLLKDAEYLIDRATTDLGVEVGKVWLTSSNRFLNGATPLDWVQTRGPGDAVAALDSTMAGSYY